MKKVLIFLFTAFVIFNFGFTLRDNQPKKAAAKNKTEVYPNIIVVKMKENPLTRLFKNDAAASKFNQLLTAYKVYSFEKIFPAKKELAKNSAVTIDLSKFYFIRYSENIDPYEAAKSFSASDLVEYAEPQFIRKRCYSPNDPSYVQGTQWALKKIQADKAWDITKGSKDVIIGIVDTGIEWYHPDLAANIWTNTKEIPNNGIDDDNNGYIDDVGGWDFGGLGNGNNPTPDNNPDEDRADHGTHVAGIASGVTDNGIGIAGVGFNCKLMAVKVSQDNRRDANQEAYVVYGYQGIVYATDNGAQIINCSWGGGGYSKYEDEIIQYANQKGTLVVAAAGNDSNFRDSYYPAAYDHVLAVASTDRNDNRSSFSNWGYYIDVCAPGTSILSTWKGGIYVYLDGTSMASPCAAGVAALVKSVYPNYTADQVGEKVRVSSDKIDDINGYFAGELGFGRVNAYKAVTISSPSIRLTSKSFDDKTYGNGNSVLEAGEKIQLSTAFKNFLDPVQNLTVTLSASSSYIKITKGTFTINNVNTLQDFNNSSNLFEFEIDKNTPLNTEIYFTLSYQSGSYTDKQTFSINLNPSYANTTVSNIDLTVTSAGNLGFNDFPDNLQGIGFRFNKSDTNLLFEGALMIAASPTQVSDAARNETSSEKDNYFKTLTPVNFSYGKVSDEDGFTIFNDDNATTPLGIKTTLNTYAFKSAPNTNFIILKYTFENTTTSPINKFYPGLFFDWDLGVDGSDNIARYDASSYMGYVKSQGGMPNTYTGVALLTGTEKISFWPIDNPGDNLWGIYDGFTLAEKYESLSSGIKRDSVGPDDISFVIGSGATSLDPGKSVTVYYAMVAGYNLADLQTAVKNAKLKLSTLDAKKPEILPDSYEVFTNYPNPFNPSTNIKFVLKEQGAVKIEVFDIKGALVKEIYKDNLPYGEGNINIDMYQKATGVYYYRFTAYNAKNEIAFVKNNKFVLLK
jgi:subtilisin family serine protease